MQCRPDGVRWRRLFGLLDSIGSDNAKGEFYLTDAVAVARAAGHACRVVEADAGEVVGVNSRAELAEVERLMQRRCEPPRWPVAPRLPIRKRCISATTRALDATWWSARTSCSGQEWRVADRVEIKPFCHLEEVTIASGAIIGPFARLRPGAEIGPDAHIGNFVEIKNARIHEGAKVNHLTYIGDATVGAKANIGAGTITCNYDGFFKSHTEIGAGAFIGSNSSLVAPITIGDGAIIGAGSVVTRDVPAASLAVSRGRQSDPRRLGRRASAPAARRRKAAKGKK